MTYLTETNKLVSVGCDLKICIWNLYDNSLELCKENAHENYITCVLKLENNVIVTGSYDKLIKIWKIE